MNPRGLSWAHSEAPRSRKNESSATDSTNSDLGEQTRETSGGVLILRDEVSTGSGSDRVRSGKLDSCYRCDPVANAPGTDSITSTSNKTLRNYRSVFLAGTGSATGA